MRRRLLPSLAIVCLAIALLVVVPAGAEPSVEILLKPVDSGYISHVEYVPRPRYTRKSLTVAEVAKELLVKALYGETLDQGLLRFVLRSYRQGYFSSDPTRAEPDVEATFYATWLLRTIGVEKEVNASLLFDYLCGAEEFTAAYYAYKTLKLLGYNVSCDCLASWNLGYAAAYIRYSSMPDVESTRLWLLVEWDEEKAEWLAEKGVYVPPPDAEASGYSGLDYSDWYNLELLMTRRPVFLNATVWPRVVVEEEPRVARARAVRWPGEEVLYSFSWELKNGTLVSTISADGRVLEFRHLLARKEYALLRIVQRPGSLVVSCSYKPPYKLTLSLAGVKYEWEVVTYEFNGTVQLPAYGVFRVRAEIEREDVVLRGEGEVRLETAYESSLLDLAFLLVPLATAIPALASSYRRRRLGLSLVLLVAPLPVSWKLLLELHPIWVTLAYGLGVLATTWYADRESFNRVLSHLVVIVALASSSMVLGNPIILLLGGFGAMLFLAAAVLYPSEASKTERFYKSVMLVYSLGVLAMSMLSHVAVTIASFMWIPDSGFVDAVRVQAMFVANLFAVAPVVAPIYHLARLIHAFERAKEAEEILKRMVPT